MGEYLEETIDSVLQNLNGDDEYFVIDGGSTDESLEIVKKYEKYLTGWVSEPDQGYADALAKGFAMTRGAFQCWINSGDLLLKEALNIARKELRINNADFIFGDDFHIDSKGDIISFSKGYVRSLRSMMLYGGWTPLQDACYWRRILFERAGGVNRNLMYAADYDLFLRFAMIGKCMYVPFTFSAFRKHDGQKSISGATKYKNEREICRRKVLSNSAIPKTMLTTLEAYYWFFVRFRAHVVQKFWNVSGLAGASAKNLRASTY